MAEESAETDKYLRFDALICHERQMIMEWSMTINTFSCPHCSYGHLTPLVVHTVAMDIVKNIFWGYPPGIRILFSVLMIEYNKVSYNDND